MKCNIKLMSTKCTFPERFKCKVQIKALRRKSGVLSKKTAKHKTSTFIKKMSRVISKIKTKLGTEKDKDAKKSQTSTTSRTSSKSTLKTSKNSKLSSKTERVGGSNAESNLDNLNPREAARRAAEERYKTQK